MREFIDERDGGSLILTHLYLLLGCALPLWLDSEFSLHPLAAFSGLLIVGVGDAAASTVGTYCGRHKWAGSRKSIEGTLGAWAATLLAAALLNRSAALHGLPHLAARLACLRFALASLLVCLMEAFTSDVDNLLLPAVYLLSMFATGCIE
jgi:dolichol kinase